MAFSFQINNDITFNHNEMLLSKADKYCPEIHTVTITPTRLAELTPDQNGYLGWAMIDSNKEIENLPTYCMKKDDSLILDFGNHRVGQFSIDIDSVGSPMDAPLFLKLKFAEIPAELGYDAADYNGWLSKSWIQEEYVHIDELPCRLELPRRYSFRYVQLLVIDSSPKWSASFSNAMVAAQTSADSSHLLPFKTDDNELEHICNVSRNTLSECMQEVFEDGPKRDRRLWLGDLRLQALANYATFDNTDIVKRCLYLFGGMTTEDGRISANVFIKPRYIPDDSFLFDYSLFFISVLYDYLQHHPDEELLMDLYPIAKKQIDMALNFVDENGQFVQDPNYPVFVDWSDKFDKSTSGQAIFIYALKQFCILAEDMDKDAASYYKRIAEQMIRFSKENLYDETTHMFISGKNKEYNISSQVWMVLANIFPAEENKLIMSAAISKLFPVTGIATPYMYHHITEALFVAGLKEDAVKLLKSYWGKMIELGADTYWEAFDPNEPEYSPYGSPIISSFCHAWGCTPVYLVQKYL